MMMIEPSSSTTSEKILEAALRCISQQGCANVGLREIAREAGVVTSQLSYYFQNKEGLFSEVMKLLEKIYLEELRAQLGPHETFHGKIAALLDHNQMILKSGEPRHRVFLDFFNLSMWSPNFSLQIQDFATHVYEVIESELRKSTGTQSQAGPIEVYSRLIMATTFGISMQNIMIPNSAENFAGFDILKKALTK